MAIRIESSPATPDARRIAALAVSFVAHAGAALLLAIPLAATLDRVAPRVIEASVTVPPPPALPMPPEPEPVARVRPPPATLPRPRRVETRVSVAAMQEPVSVAAVEPVSDVAAEVPTTTTGPGERPGWPTGESRVLAYDGALKLSYPRAAIRRQAQGTVVLHVLVGTDGVAQRIELSRSSGHRDLDDAAREAVRKARFRPVLEKGVAVPAWGLVPIEFTLARG